MLSGQIKIISTLGDLSARPTIIFLNWLISGVQKITTDSTISWMKERGSCSNSDRNEYYMTSQSKVLCQVNI